MPVKLLPPGCLYPACILDGDAGWTQEATDKYARYERGMKGRGRIVSNLFDDTAAQKGVLIVKHGYLPGCDGKLRFIKDQLNPAISSGNQSRSSSFVRQANLC